MDKEFTGKHVSIYLHHIKYIYIDIVIDTGGSPWTRSSQVNMLVYIYTTSNINVVIDTGGSQVNP